MAAEAKVILCNTLGQYQVKGDPPAVHHDLTDLLTSGWEIVSSLVLPFSAVSGTYFIQYVLFFEDCRCDESSCCTT